MRQVQVFAESQIFEIRKNRPSSRLSLHPGACAQFHQEQRQWGQAVACRDLPWLHSTLIRKSRRFQCCSRWERLHWNGPSSNKLTKEKIPHLLNLGINCVHLRFVVTRSDLVLPYNTQQLVSLVKAWSFCPSLSLTSRKCRGNIPRQGNISVSTGATRPALWRQGHNMSTTQLGSGRISGKFMKILWTCRLL